MLDKCNCVVVCMVVTWSTYIIYYANLVEVNPKWPHCSALRHHLAVDKHLQPTRFAIPAHPNPVALAPNMLDHKRCSHAWVKKRLDQKAVRLASDVDLRPDTKQPAGYARRKIHDGKDSLVSAQSYHEARGALAARHEVKRENQCA